MYLNLGLNLKTNVELFFSTSESEESEIGVGGEFAGEIDDREEEEIAAVQQVSILKIKFFSVYYELKFVIQLKILGQEVICILGPCNVPNRAKLLLLKLTSFLTTIPDRPTAAAAAAGRRGGCDDASLHEPAVGRARPGSRRRRGLHGQQEGRLHQRQPGWLQHGRRRRR